MASGFWPPRAVEVMLPPVGCASGSPRSLKRVSTSLADGIRLTVQHPQSAVIRGDRMGCAVNSRQTYGMSEAGRIIRGCWYCLIDAPW
jgi:hypothetical protein